MNSEVADMHLILRLTLQETPDIFMLKSIPIVWYLTIEYSQNTHGHLAEITF